jgi:hypothetical protein
MSRAAYALVGMEVEKIWGTIVPRFAGTRKRERANREHDTISKSNSKTLHLPVKIVPVCSAGDFISAHSLNRTKYLERSIAYVPR